MEVLEGQDEHPLLAGERAMAEWAYHPRGWQATLPPQPREQPASRAVVAKGGCHQVRLVR